MPAVRQVQSGYSEQSVAQLREAWGNTGYSADVDFLMQAVRLARTNRRGILECGSGVSTFLLACLKIPLYSLENDAEWAVFCTDSIRRCGLESQVIYSPLISYGEQDWYKLPADLPQISLVLCDGPPGTTRGGRSGLMYAIEKHLADEYTILMDDVDRPAEHALAEQWRDRYGLDLEFIHANTRTIAILTTKKS